MSSEKQKKRKEMKSTKIIKQEQQVQSSSSATAAEGLSTSSYLRTSRLGYAFPSYVSNNKYFDEFIAGFKRSGVECFTQLQCQMLDELIHNRAFQVTSTDVSCGSGKTSLTVAATIGLFEEKDLIIFVNKPGRGESSLTRELKQLVEKFSGGPSMMRVSTVLNDVDAMQLVPESDVIITNCIALVIVLETLVSTHQLTGCSRRKVHIIFDEAHKIFNHDGLTKLAEWTGQQDKETLDGKMGCIRPSLSYVEQALTQIYEFAKDQQSLTIVPVFLSAVGDFAASKFQKKGVEEEKKLCSSEVIEMCINQWMKTPVTKLVNTGNNSERNYNCIFKIHREGAAQIGGTVNGYALVYEAMMKIALHRLIEGRMLFIVRRQQVDTFAAMLDEKISESGPFFSYTTDRDYWNAIDEKTSKPLYNIVIVREDELDDLEGVNIEGLKAVYLFSLGKTRNLYQKMQGLGRVGRLGQEASYCFVMIDCATKKNGAIEAESSPFLLDAMKSNGTCRPQIVEVMGAKALLDIPSDIPVYKPNFQEPTPMQLEKIKRTIKKANLPQVCKYMRYSRKSGMYECPSIQQGYKCAWYHPRPTDFVANSTALKCCSFNTSYCKKGVFREGRCTCINSMVPIAPVTPDSMAWTARNPVHASVLSPAHFPKLGEEKIEQETANKEYLPALSKEAAPLNPRLSRPVCRFAVMDMYKCKTRKQGKVCFFRHPEEAEDKVSDEEYLDTLKLSIENLNKNRKKYGQKALVFSKDLYSKYNYPGRHKSNLVKPVAKAIPEIEPASSLASVLSNKQGVSSDSEESSALFCALKNAFEKKVASSSTPVEDMVEIDESQNSSDLNILSDTSVEGNGFTEVVARRKATLKKSTAQVTVPVIQKCEINSFELLMTDEVDVDEEDNVEVKDDSEAFEKEIVCDDTGDKMKGSHGDVDSHVECISPCQELFNTHVANATVLIQSGLQGIELVDQLRFSSTGCDTTAAALATALLRDQVPDSFNFQLFSEDIYGLGLKYLLKLSASASDYITSQADLLEAVELYCVNQNIVKVGTKSGEKYIIDMLFRVLYAFELVDEEGFFSWHKRCDFANVAREDMKLKAVLQTTEFFGWLLQDESTDEPSSESDNNEICPPVVEDHTEELMPEQLSKAERKALKQQRRQEKLASRGDCENSKLSQIRSYSSNNMMMSQ